MSKALQGVADLGIAAGLMTALYFDPMLAFSPTFWKVTVGFAAMGVSNELSAALSTFQANGGTTTTNRQSAGYRPITYGERMVPGSLIYNSTTGSKHDQDNNIIVLNDGEINAIVSMYLDGRKVFFEPGSTGNVTRNGINFGGSADDNTYIGPDGSHYNFNTLVYCEPRFGDQVEGDVIGGMTANDPTWAAGPNGSPWCGGLAYVYFKWEYDQSMFPQRPAVSFVIQGKNNIWDPRLGAYGEAGAMVYTNNWALCIADVLMNTDYGLGVSPSAINTDQLIAAANVCDEQVACAVGTEARYTCNYTTDTQSTTGDILSGMMSAAAGRLSYVGGQWYIWPSYWQGPSSTWDQSDFVGVVSWNPKRSIRDLFNRVSGTYIAPWYPYSVTGNLYDQNGWYDGTIANTFNLAWQPTSVPPYAQDPLHGYASDEWLAEDGGKIMYKDLGLPACISVSQAQRVFKITLLRNRFQETATLQMSLAAYQNMPIDTLDLTFSTCGWNESLFEVQNVRFVPELNGGSSSSGSSSNKAPRIYTQIDVAQTDPSIYEWNASDELTVNDVPALGGGIPYVVAPPTTMTLDSSAATAIVSVDGIVTPRVQVSWDSPDDHFVTMIQIQYQLVGASTWTDAGAVDVGLFQTFITGVIAGLEYNIQIRSLRANGATSVWVEQTNYTVSTTYSSIASSGINPNSPYNVSNDATIDSIAESGAASIRVYGPGGVGTPWDLITGAGTRTEPATDITGLLFGNVYYIVLDPVTGDYQALTTYNDSLSDTYVSLGSLITVLSDGTGGQPGGGYGGGVGSPRNPISCTVEGTLLDGPNGLPIDNRLLKSMFDAGQDVYLQGRDVPERVVHADWVEVAEIFEVTVGAREPFRCSGSHTLLDENGKYRWTSTLPEKTFLNTRTDLEPATITKLALPARVLKIELSGPSHEYSAHQVWSHNVLKNNPG